jgi:hypothetical protein
VRDKQIQTALTGSKLVKLVRSPLVHYTIGKKGNETIETRTSAVFVTQAQVNQLQDRPVRLLQVHHDVIQL